MGLSNTSHQNGSYLRGTAVPQWLRRDGTPDSHGGGCGWDCYKTKSEIWFGYKKSSHFHIFFCEVYIHIIWLFFFNWPLSPFSSRLTGFYILRELLLVCDVNCKYFSVGHCLWHCLLAEMVTFLSINASIFYFSCIFFNGSSVMVGNTLHSEVKNIIVFFCYFI